MRDKDQKKIYKRFLDNLCRNSVNNKYLNHKRFLSFMFFIVVSVSFNVMRNLVVEVAFKKAKVLL